MINLTLDQYKTSLYKKYTVIDFIDLNDFHHPADLYERIKSCKKEIFADNERIVFVYSKNKFKYLIEVLEILDIPDFFIVMLVHQDFSDSVSGSSLSIIHYKGIPPTNVLTFDLPENHCIYPWINLLVDNLGNVAPCCIFQTDQHISLNDYSLKEIYSSDSFNQYRDDFRKNKKIEGCRACWQNEKFNLPSMRTLAKNKLQDIYYKIDYSSNDISNLKMLDLKLGNSCNLTCRICDEKNSSSIAKLKLKFDELSLDDYNNIKKLTTWASSDRFNNQLLELADNLLYLDIYGGEPFMNKSHFDFLKKLINLGVSHKISIDYNSNGTLYSEKFFSYWEEFKKVKVSFSIDDIEKRFELQRSGSNWDTVKNNITQFNSKTSDTFITDIFATVSIQNVYYLPELVEWANTQNFKDGISFNLLTSPSVLAINNLPDDVKQQVKQKLSSYPMFDTIISFMFSKPNSTKNVIDFLKTHDFKRNQNYFSTHAEFAEILTNSPSYRIQ